MQFELIRNRIWDLNLAIDLDSIKLIHKFIEDHIGSILDQQNEDQLYSIYAAAGIVLEELKVQTVDGKQWVSSGLTIQLLMSKLQGLDLNKYLGRINSLLEKYKLATQELRHKVNQLVWSYRLFCKYRKLINKLFIQMPGNLQDLLEDTTSLIWEIYLLFKHQHPQLDLQEQSKTLIGCMLYIFNKIQVKKQKIDYHLIQTEFSCIQTINQKEIVTMVDKLLEDLLVKRYNQTNFFSFYSNIYKRQRLLDDIRIRYEQTKNSHLKVDQIKYLKLPVNLTPFRPTKPAIFSNTYNVRLDFEELNASSKLIIENQLQTELFPSEQFEQISLFNKKESQIYKPLLGEYIGPAQVECTPLTSRTKDVQWINTKIRQMNQSKIQQLKSIFSEVSLSCYKQTQKFCFDLLQKLLSMTTSDQSIIQSRKSKIWSFFQRMLLLLSLNQSNVVDNCTLLADKQYITAILCIITYIYLNTNSLPLSQLKEISKIYQCSYQLILYHLHKIKDMNLGIPPILSQNLNALESTILLRHCWEDEIAYDLLKNGAKDIYSSFFVERLNKEITQRIQNITKNHKRLQKSVKDLVFYVMASKTNLLDGSFIDQIILCSFYYIVSLNPEESNLSFEEIFKIYSKLPNSFQEYKNRVTIDNITYTLLQFYKLVFSSAIKQFQVPLIMMEVETPSFPLMRKQSDIQVASSNKKTNKVQWLKANAKIRKEESLKNKKQGEDGGLSTTIPLLRSLSFSKEANEFREDDNSMTFGFNRSQK